MKPVLQSYRRINLSWLLTEFINKRSRCCHLALGHKGMYFQRIQSPPNNSQSKKPECVSKETKKMWCRVLGRDEVKQENLVLNWLVKVKLPPRRPLLAHNCNQGSQTSNGRSKI